MAALKTAVTGQTHEARADSTVLMWPGVRKPLGDDLMAVLEAELESMTQLELDVSYPPEADCFIS